MKPRTGTVFFSDRYKCYIAKISATHPITKQVKEWKRHAETSREAHEKLKELHRLADRWIAQEAPESLDPARMTFEDLAKIYEKKKMIPAKYVAGTKVAGRRSLRHGPRTWLANFRAYFGKKKLAQIKVSDIEDYHLHLVEKPVGKEGQRAVASINRELEFLRSVLLFAVKNRYLDESPFPNELIDRQAENRRERFPSFGEDLALLAQCTGPREHLQAPFIIAVDTGLRRNEMFTLAIADIDFARGVITVRKENAKNNKAREIPMTPRVRQALHTLCEENDTGLVFGGLKEPKRAWKTTKKEAQIADLTWHDLRHAFVTRSILAGIPPAAVLKASGHISDQEWKRYLNMTPDQLRRMLTPRKGQSQDEVKLYAATVMKGLRDALHYDELERVFDLLK